MEKWYMDKDAPIAIFDGSESRPDVPVHDSELVELKLNILGNSLHFYITAENKPVRLSALVPLARLLSTKIITVIKEYVINNGGTIVCQANCSQCCRYLVSLAIPEVIQLNEEVMQMPKWKHRFVCESTALTARQILELTPKDLWQELAEAQSEIGSKLNSISKWYHSMNLPCPFLLKNMCIIYNQRPIACREHFVVNSAPDFCCKPNSTKQPQLLQMPISIAEALAELTSELEQKPVETIILPFALAWYDKNYGYFKHIWPASQLVRRFINVLTTQNSHNNKPKL
ncbi:MAG: YkgJ family cysteine cluster protein [Planctomycetota bacterium]